MASKKYLEELQKDLESELEEVRLKELMADYNEEDRVLSFQEIQEKIEERKDKGVAFKSSLGTLDNIIEGFNGGNLITVAGETGQGKTLVCQSLTRKFSEQDISSLWFSYEVPLDEFLTEFGDNVKAFHPNKLTNSSLEWIEQRIVEGIVKYDIKVVFIDHLHFLINMVDSKGGVGNFSLVIGAVMRELKKIALKYKVVIFLISHLRKVEGSSRPTINDLRDSTFQAQESDFVFIVSRDKYGEEWLDSSTLSIEKNRRSGRLGKIKLIKQDGFLQEEPTEEEIEEILSRESTE